jgi:hypothetical protein
VQADLEKLLQERRSAKDSADDRVIPSITSDVASSPPVAELQPVSPASPGRELVLAARISAPAGVKWARLRYRHLNQYEDYEMAEMTLDAATGLYKGMIPAAFIDPKWDLMYFVEVVDRAGDGRIFPDLEREHRTWSSE